MFKPTINPQLVESDILTVTTHTGGEVTRIIMNGFPQVLGETMMDKKNYLMKNYDNLRKSLMLEPRGHKNMFGALFTEPTHKEADLGVIFMDTEGYLNMCGHGTIGSVTAAIETGIVKAKEPVTEVVLDTPAGIVKTNAKVENGKVKEVTLLNVPSFLYKENLMAKIDEHKIKFDISFGGSFFAMVDIDSLKIEICPENIDMITKIGMKLLEYIKKNIQVSHPILNIKSVDLVEFYSHKAENTDFKNVVIFGNAMADRSPCGTGCSAKLAQLYGKNLIKVGDKITTQSFIGSIFQGKVAESVSVGEFKAIRPSVTGRAFIISMAHHYICKDDPFPYGFSVE